MYPIRCRILFFYFDGKGFVLLNHFVKKTQKTPAREINRAKKFMNEYRNRGDENEQNV